MRERLTDSELDRLLAASDPHPDRGSRLDAAAEQTLARILATATPRPRRRLVWTMSLPALAAAVVALIVVLVVNPFAPAGPAAAKGLRPLTFTPVSLSLDEQLDAAQEMLAVSAGPAEPVRQGVTVAWYAHVTMDGPDEGTVISPEVMTITWNEDLSSNMHVTVGRGYRPGDEGIEIPVREGLPAVGTVVRDDDFTAEEMGYSDSSMPAYLEEGSSLEFYRDAFERMRGEQPSGAATALQQTGDFLRNWTLTNAQEANILEVLRTQPGLELLGSTTDRAGRDVFGLAAASDTGMHEVVMLVSLETGRIVGTEVTYLGHDEEIPIPTNSVMSYELWDVPASQR